MTSESSGSGQRFPTTKWSTILDLSTTSSEVAGQALNLLCREYLEPLRGYAQDSGWSPPDAEDAVQGFLADVCCGGLFQKADPAKGTLRGLLRTALRHYLLNRIEEKKTVRRGGGAEHLPLEAAEGCIATSSGQGQCETAGPDEMFDRRWAAKIMERAMARLRHSYESRGGLHSYEVLSGSLGWNEGPPHAELAEILGIKTEQVAVRISRMRQQLRRLLIEEIQFVTTAGENPDDELRYLISLFRGR